MKNATLVQRARAFDYLFDAVVVTDLQGIITDWNNGSEKLFGYKKDEAIGLPVSSLRAPGERQNCPTTEVLQCVKEQGRWNGELKMLRKNGDTTWVESMIVPLFNDCEQMIGALGINRDINQQKEKEEHLAKLAHYDQLTNLPNRYLLMDRLEHLIKHAERDRSKFALLYIDLDNFKAVNDNEGHANGDYVLQKTAQKLKESIRKSDTVARIGGDEFVVLLETIKDDSDAALLADNIIEVLHEPYLINNRVYRVTGSVGIAIYPNNGLSTDELLLHSDKAMYEVKNACKDAYLISNN